MEENKDAGLLLTSDSTGSCLSYSGLIALLLDQVLKF